MQKSLSPKLIVTIVITILCIFFCLPTLRYFIHVAGMGDEPTEEQVAKKNDLLENSNIIKLGLDLQGGADFLISVDVDRLVRHRLETEMEDNLRTGFRRKDIDASLRIVGTNAETMRISVTINNVADVDLAAEIIQQGLEDSEFIAYEGDLRAALAKGPIEITPRSERLRDSVTEAMEGALKVINGRVDEFGLTQPIVQRAEGNRIRVQLPGENNPTRIRTSLLRTAVLEFRLLHPEHDTQIQAFIKGGIVPEAGTGVIKDEFLEDYVVEETKKVEKRLKANIPGVPAGYVLRLGRQNHIDPATGQIIKEKSIENLAYLVSQNPSLTGDSLRRASVFVDPQEIRDPVKVSLEFDSLGAKRFGEITTDNVGKRFSIILDEQVYSAPNINEPITQGRAVISGGFSQAEARDLSLVLKAGALPAPLRVIEENTVGPFLGADSIAGAGKALIIGAILIIILMVGVYRTCGVVSVLAMFLNVGLIIAILSLMGATLTLSGIGGILLTMGMAVDANILIYERLREELKAGNPMRAAISTAFARAYTVILDSNVTSLLPALVLVLFEVVDGSVKGFWVTLVIGLIANLYTGVVVSRALIEFWYAQVRDINVGTFQLFRNVHIPWMKYRNIGIAFSAGTAIVAMGYLAVMGPSYGIDFTGGVLSTAEVPKVESAAPLREAFSDYKDVRIVKVVNRPDQWQITLPLPEEGGKSLNDLRHDIETRLSEKFPGSTVLSSQSVDATVGKEFRVVAIASLIITCGVILSYLAFRFQWIFGAGAVLALVHDVFLALGVFKMLGHSLTLDIVSALLIILGYSVNDTIVVFDRIRERMQERLSGNLEDIINEAINETLNRTVLTSGSTFLAVLAMWLFGGSGLADFALILLLGIFFGTYSSIFIASGLVYAYMHSKGLTTVLAARKATTRVVVPKTTAKKLEGEKSKA